MKQRAITLIPFFISLIMLSGCRKSPEFDGTYHSETKNYKVELLSIELLNFSFNTTSYQYNDPSNGPDVFFIIERIDGYNDFTNTYNQVFNNMQSADLPHTFIFNDPPLIAESLEVADQDLGKSFKELGFVLWDSDEYIMMYDFDGTPGTYTDNSGYRQALSGLFSGYYVFAPGTHFVQSTQGDAVVTYRISES